MHTIDLRIPDEERQHSVYLQPLDKPAGTEDIGTVFLGIIEQLKRRDRYFYSMMAQAHQHGGLFVIIRECTACSGPRARVGSALFHFYANRVVCGNCDRVLKNANTAIARILE